MTIQPIGDKLLIQPEKENKEKTVSGIYIPETSSDKPQIGTVLAAGQGRILENGTIMPLFVKTGDRVLFRKFAGTELKLEGQENTYLLITERDVLGIIRKENNYES